MDVRDFGNKLFKYKSGSFVNEMVIPLFATLFTCYLNMIWISSCSKITIWRFYFHSYQSEWYFAHIFVCFNSSLMNLMNKYKSQSISLIIDWFSCQWCNFKLIFNYKKGTYQKAHCMSSFLWYQNVLVALHLTSQWRFNDVSHKKMVFNGFTLKVGQCLKKNPRKMQLW